MLTDPNATPAEWAMSLTLTELADQLRRLCADVYCMSPEERGVVLARAAVIVGDQA